MTASAPWEHTLDPAISSRGTLSFRRYLSVFFLLTVIAYVAAFFLIRSQAYSTWRQSQWGPMLEFSYAPGPRNADVLIFGDSSAFIGIDPRLLQSRLSVNALLLPNTVGSLPITEDIPLKRYLQTHRAPRLIVFYFSPWNLDYRHASGVRFFEGEEMIFRHGTPAEIGSFMLRYPGQFIFFPFRFYNTYGLGMIKSLLSKHHPAPASVEAALGHLDDRDPFPTLASTCEIPERLMKEQSMSSVSNLVSRYDNKLPVLVYMAPVPGCTNVNSALQRNFGAVHAAAPQVLPATNFVGDPYYAHMEPNAVPAATQLLANAIQRRLSSSPAAPPK